MHTRDGYRKYVTRALTLTWLLERQIAPEPAKHARWGYPSKAATTLVQAAVYGESEREERHKWQSGQSLVARHPAR